MKKVFVVLLLLAAGGGGAAYYWRSATNSGPEFRTATVQRQDLVATVSATGTVEPVEVIDVGAQIAGRIVTFGADPGSNKPIDFGSQVEEGTILARIDETLYRADVEAQEAQVAQAKANLERTKAELTQTEAQFRQAERDWKRAQQIMSTSSNALAETDIDNYRAKYETTQAAITVGRASISQTEKAIALAQANLNRVKTNLGYCTIKSPVKGVIIARRVNVGQTVVASLNAPSLFLIAKDLSNMQVWVAVNEADIGRIHPDQPVAFTVDAYPGQMFSGKVNKIRLNASMTQNVVTYTVEVNTDNSSRRLLPYLSANVKFEVSRQKAALTVPNSALNWTPAPNFITPSARASANNATSKPESASDGKRRTRSDGEPRKERSRPDGRPRKAESQPAPAEPQTGTVWIPDGEFVKPVRVTLGGSDGTNTAVTGPELEEGMEVVIGQMVQSAGGDGTVNPFAPKFPGGGRGLRH
jgi:HlyD family secretion protein